jgi:hypothetical protein
LPENDKIQVDTGKMKQGEKQYYWFNPTNGNQIKVDSNPDHVYFPPLDWEDSILIIDLQSNL